MVSGFISIILQSKSICYANRLFYDVTYNYQPLWAATWVKEIVVELAWTLVVDLEIGNNMKTGILNEKILKPAHYKQSSFIVKRRILRLKHSIKFLSP